MLSRKACLVVAATACVAAASASFAALLGVLPGMPALTYDNNGTAGYSATMGVFSVEASPLAIRLSPTEPPRFVYPTGNPPVRILTISVQLDENGILAGGAEQEDLVVVGKIDADSDGYADYDGTLLTGEVAAMGFEDTGESTDQYDFRFTVTGGLLADDFFLNQDIGLILTSENSNFAGDFTVDFGGGAKGILGPIPLPVQLSGCTPGYWKQEHHFDSWPDLYDPNMLFEDVFGRDVPGEPLLVEALRLNKGGLNALMRHTVAALLNAASSDVNPAEAFDQVEEVIAAFQTAFDSGDYETLKNCMEDSNEAGCPLD